MSAREKITVDVPAIGTSWTIAEITGRPARYYIWRVRAIKLSGTATTIALKVSETAAAEDQDIVLEYSATPDFIDYEEPGWLFASAKGLSQGKGSTYIGCQADTTGNVFRIILDVEPLN